MLSRNRCSINTNYAGKLLAWLFQVSARNAPAKGETFIHGHFSDSSTTRWSPKLKIRMVKNVAKSASTVSFQIRKHREQFHIQIPVFRMMS